MKSKEKTLEKLGQYPDRYRALEQMYEHLNREQAENAEELARALLPTRCSTLELQTYRLNMSGSVARPSSHTIGLLGVIGSLWRLIEMVIRSWWYAITDAILEKALDLALKCNDNKELEHKPKTVSRKEP